VIPSTGCISEKQNKKEIVPGFRGIILNLIACLCLAMLLLLTSASQWPDTPYILKTFPKMSVILQWGVYCYSVWVFEKLIPTIKCYNVDNCHLYYIS